jgi:hypothetical protein
MGGESFGGNVEPDGDLPGLIILSRLFTTESSNDLADHPILVILSRHLSIAIDHHYS